MSYKKNSNWTLIKSIETLRDKYVDKRDYVVTKDNNLVNGTTTRGFCKEPCLCFCKQDYFYEIN